MKHIQRTEAIMESSTSGTINDMTGADDWSTELLNLLDHLLGLVDRLETMGDQQRQLVEQKDTEGLLGLLGDRQKIVGQFTAAQDQLEGLLAEYQDRLSYLPVENRNVVQKRVDAINERMGEILKRDAEDQALLEQERLQVNAELKGVQLGQTARSAYQGRGQRADTRFADKRG